MGKNKIKTLDEIVKIAEQAKKHDKKVVTTNGCFDILHKGHIASLKWAKSKGDVLIVGINSDKSVRAIKGNSRPINNQTARAQALTKIKSVDYVFIFNERTPTKWLAKVKPDMHVKGKDTKNNPNFPADAKAVEKNGGKILLAPMLNGYSTTKIIDSILKKNK